MSTGTKRLLRAVVGLIAVLGLTAGSCGSARPGDVAVCFEFDGEEVCDTRAGRTVTMRFGFDASLADNYVVRFHPEDADRYHLNEVVSVEGNPDTTRSMAVIERNAPAPSQVCLRHNVYLQNIVEREQTVLYKAGHCSLLNRGWQESEGMWEPY